MPSYFYYWVNTSSTYYSNYWSYCYMQTPTSSG